MQPEVDDSDPRILRQDVGTGSAWKDVWRELVRIEGAIWYRLVTVYRTPLITVSEWSPVPAELDTALMGGQRFDAPRGIYMTPNPVHAEFSADLDRHDLELEHAADPLNATVLSGGAL